MAEKSSKTSTGEKPKGILKHSSSYDDSRTEVHWDEMNILQTYHPADKDYGHMKIQEPSTPYNYNYDSDPEEHVQFDPEQLAKKIQNVPEDVHKTPQLDAESSSDDDLTSEQQATRKAFKDKRKHHYNEYDNVKLARELIQKELAELEDENEQVSGK